MLALPMLIAAFSACSAFGPRPEADAADRDFVVRMASLRESGQPQQALDELRDFLIVRNDSLYLQAARLEEGRCLEELGRPAEADAIYRDVRDKTLEKEPRLSAQAEWRLSFTAEAAGDDLKAVSHVLSAEKRKADLPEKTARAEVPARKAALLQKIGREDDAEKAVKEADRGLRELLSGPKPKPDDAWMANLYLEMGRSLARSVDAGNFASYLKAQKSSQNYLIKALAYGDTPAAPKAFEILRSNYSDFWNLIRNMPAASDVHDPVLATRMKREAQIPLLTEFLKVLEEAQRLRLHEESGESPLEKDFFALTDDLATKARRVLYASPASTILTEESRLLNGLRRGPGPTAPSSPVKTDPNL